MEPMRFQTKLIKEKDTFSLYLPKWARDRMNIDPERDVSVVIERVCTDNVMTVTIPDAEPTT